MLHWKIRLALLLTSLSTLAWVGGAVVKWGGFYW
jgi:hypothetical protein